MELLCKVQMYQMTFLSKSTQEIPILLHISLKTKKGGNFFPQESHSSKNSHTLIGYRAVPRIFCLPGQTPSAGAHSTNLHRDLTDRVSSQTLC